MSKSVVCMVWDGIDVFVKEKAVRGGWRGGLVRCTVRVLVGFTM